MCGSRWQEAWSLYESTMSADSVAEVWEALRPPPTIVCEVCLRERLTQRFPGSVVASVIHHLALPGRDPRRTVWSCKEMQSPASRRASTHRGSPQLPTSGCVTAGWSGCRPTRSVAAELAAALSQDPEAAAGLEYRLRELRHVIRARIR